MNSIRRKRIKKDENLYESSDSTLTFETIERNKDLETTNINYANSRRGRFFASCDRLSLQLRALYDRNYILVKRKTGEYIVIMLKSLDKLRLFLYNEYCNKTLRKDKKIMSNTNDTTTTKSTKNTKSKAANTTDVKQESRWDSFVHGIMGILTLFVIVSIAYSSWVIVQGTDDPIHRIMLVPMVLWAVVKLIKQFTKQGDK